MAPVGIPVGTPAGIPVGIPDGIPVGIPEGISDGNKMMVYPMANRRLFTRLPTDSAVGSTKGALPTALNSTVYLRESMGTRGWNVRRETHLVFFVVKRKAWKRFLPTISKYAAISSSQRFQC
jgi:hypothetical protein